MKKIIIQLSVFMTLYLQCFNSVASQPVISIVSQNLHRFFDDKNDGNNEKIISTKKYQNRLKNFIQKISSEFEFADVIAVQEIENINILLDTSKLLKKKFGQQYQPVLIEGNDISGIDVGFLVKKKFRLKSIKSLFKDQLYSGKKEKLFSRPPLLINICHSECLTIINIHLRSMRGLRSPDKQQRISLKRRLQAETLARWIDQFQHRNPREKLLIIGDYNALSPSDFYVDSLGTIIGKPDKKRPKWKSPDLIKNDLIDTSLVIPEKNRFSYRFKNKKQLLDYLLISQNLKHNLTNFSLGPIDYRFSDHAALKAKFSFNVY